MANKDSTKTLRKVFAPTKRRKKTASLLPKYHFCFSPIDSSQSNRLYSLVDKLFGDYDFCMNILCLNANHGIRLSIDDDGLTHIDFIGDEWSNAETDAVFDKIRSVLRANNMFFAFTNYREKLDIES